MDRRLLVLAACAVGVLALQAVAVIQAAQLDEVDLRSRLLWAASTTSPLTGLLLVIAAAAAVHANRGTAVVLAMGTVLVTVGLAGFVAIVTESTSRVVLASKVSESFALAPGALLAGFAIWLSTDRGLSAGGSPPDEESA